MHVIGLTGGIASGKTTVGRVFERLGVPVVDADRIARDVVAPGQPALRELCEAFGPEILLPSGELDRKALARLAFADGISRARLNGITHPRIAAATQSALTKLREGTAELACYEATLLVENGLADAFRPLVVVRASEALQLARAMVRDGATEEDVRARLAGQMPLADKLAAADVVIDNDGDLAALEIAAEKALVEVRKLLTRR